MTTTLNLGWTSTSRSRAVEQANLEGLRKSIEYMPEGRYKHFNRWLLARPDFAENWAQLLGLRGTARMTDEVLEDLLSESQLEQMVELCVPMTMMLTYEVASDNVAIGLANHLSSDKTLPKRIELLTGFGEVMIRKLRGETTPTAILMQPYRELIEQISSFSQSLSEHKYHHLLQAYLEDYPDADTTAIEYSLYEILIANIDCGVDVINILNGYQMQDFIREWLIRRYEAQTFLVNNRQMSQERLIRASIDAIMVVPTMAYYVAHFVERVAPNPAYCELLENGTLLAALEKTALLVRILNDLGTDVVEQSDEAHAAWIAELRQVQAEENYGSFIELMMEFIPNKGVSFTRLKKDVVFGEYNLALHFPRLESNVEQAIDMFYQQLCYVSQVYRENWAELRQLASLIEEKLGTPMVSKLLLRFVQYHQHFYRNSFEGSDGEYGI